MKGADRPPGKLALSQLRWSGVASEAMAGWGRAAGWPGRP